MKKKKLISIILALFLIIYGSLIIIIPSITNFNIIYLYLIFLVTYIILNLLKYLINNEGYQKLYYVAFGIIDLILLSLVSNDNILIPLLIFIILISILKLRENIFKENKDIKALIFLILFIISGMLCVTTINNYENTGIYLGYFYFIFGIINLFEII